MIRLLAMSLLILLINSTVRADNNASLSLSTDTDSLYLGDILVLELEAVGLLEDVDTGVLTRNATLVRETRGTRISVVNGKVVENVVRRMELMPTAEGLIIFGPLAGDTSNGGITSNSVSINVLAPLDTHWVPGPDDLELSVELSTRTPVIGEQIVADFVLRHRHPTADESVVLPDFDEFDAIAVFESRRTLDNSDGGWRRVAWRYLLYPKSSGSIVLDGIHWAGMMNRSRTQRGLFDVRSESIALDVGAATGTDSGWWLPARQVTLTESWSKDVRELSAGDEVIRTITLTADGVLSRQLPDIEPLPSRAISSTTIAASRSQKITDVNSSATAEFQFRMTAQSPVPVFLDTVRVAWWDVVNGEQREAIIPARRINVGLPERADVLSSLAMDDSLWSRGRLWLQSAQWWQYVLYLAFGLLILTIARMGLPALWQRLQRHFQNWQFKREMRALLKQQSWQAMYTCLLDFHKRHPVSDASAEINIWLEKRLFSHVRIKGEPAENEQQLMTLINQTSVQRDTRSEFEPLPTL